MRFFKKFASWCRDIAAMHRQRGFLVMIYGTLFGFGLSQFEGWEYLGGYIAGACTVGGIVWAKVLRERREHQADLVYIARQQNQRRERVVVQGEVVNG